MIRPSFHEQAENRRLNHMINTMIHHENRILTMINHSPAEMDPVKSLRISIANPITLLRASQE